MRFHSTDQRDATASTPFPSSTACELRLDGLWPFHYEPRGWAERGSAPPPPAVAFDLFMPVPAHWDDHLDGLRAHAGWSQVVLNPKFRPLAMPCGTLPPDASLPHLHGTGWYRREVCLPAGAPDDRWFVEIGPCQMELRVWWDGRLLHHHAMHATPCELELPDAAPGSHTLMLAVDNTRQDRTGCDIRGWKGQSGGILESVILRRCGAAALRALYVHASPSLDRLHWQVELHGAPPAGCDLRWWIRGCGGEILAEASWQPWRADWQTPAAGLQPWSDRQPVLYRIGCALRHDGRVVDSREQTFGLRRLSADGRRLLLNGRSVFLRGATEHGYYPHATTRPRDPAFYRQTIRRLQAVGFNWLRFHTAMPDRAYLEAADREGMLVQVEAPLGHTLEEWEAIVRCCRVHPCAVIYCPGNEETLDEDKLAFLEQEAASQKRLAPDALFNPQEALRGVEYGRPSDFGAAVVDSPYPHRPDRLAFLKRFSDVFGHYSWGDLSYNSSEVDRARLDARQAVYERPLLSHEVGIVGNYLDLSLAPRYRHSRIGSGLFDATRDNLERAGLLDRAPLYYRASCHWARETRKHAIESARLCRHLNGYDFLGAIDCHWHRTGYDTGLLNEFHECKPGDSEAAIRDANGEDVLLLDHDLNRNYAAGDTLRARVWLALFSDDVPAAEASWCLREPRGRVWARGRFAPRDLAAGGLVELGALSWTVPASDTPRALELRVALHADSLDLRNSWRFWIFPRAAPEMAAGVRIASRLGEPEWRALAAGERLLLLGTAPFPSVPTSAQPACAGRAIGHLATLITDHPMLSGFPHDGWCDWQFRNLLRTGAAVIGDDLPLPFDPVIEIVGNYKLIHKQAALFECRVGEGVLLVCGLDLSTPDAAAAWLRARLLGYLADNPQPAHRLDSAWLRALPGVGHAPDALVTDQAIDANVVNR